MNLQQLEDTKSWSGPNKHLVSLFSPPSQAAIKYSVRGGSSQDEKWL